MTRMWQYVASVGVLIVVLLVGCAQPAAPAQPPAPKPAESAPAKPAVKPAEKPAPAAQAKPTAQPAAQVKPTAQPAAQVKPTAQPAAQAKPAAKKDLPSSVGVGTHPVGGGFHAVGMGISKVVSDHTPMKVLVKPFAGPNAWMPMMQTGELDLGVLGGPDAGDAYSGGVTFDKAYKNLRLVTQGNIIAVAALAVRVDSGINAIKDLKGKRVTSDYGGNVSIRENVAAALDSAGLTYDDVLKVPVSDYSSGLRSMSQGRVDATFAGSTTLAATMETDAGTPLSLLNFGDLPPEQAANAPKAVIDKLRERRPGATVFSVKKEGWLKSDATLFGFRNWLGASNTLNADAVYEIAKALYQYDKELHPVHAWAADWKQQTMFVPDPPAPYHEGAIRFWKEIGKWTPEAEAHQKKLLGQ